MVETFNTFLDEGLLDPLLQYLVKETNTKNEYKVASGGKTRVIFKYF